MLAGKLLSITAQNDLKKLNNTVYLKYNAFFHQNFKDKQYADGVSMSNSLINDRGTYDHTTGVTTWVLDDPYYQNQLNINPVGAAYFYFVADNVIGSSNFPSQEQDADFSVTIDGISLVTGNFTRNYVEGFTGCHCKNPDHYQQYVDNPYGLVGETSGFGIWCRAQLEVYFGGRADQAAAYAAVMARQLSTLNSLFFLAGKWFQIKPWGSAEIVFRQDPYPQLDDP